MSGPVYCCLQWLTSLTELSTKVERRGKIVYQPSNNFSQVGFLNFQAKSGKLTAIENSDQNNFIFYPRMFKLKLGNYFFVKID